MNRKVAVVGLALALIAGLWFWLGKKDEPAPGEVAAAPPKASTLLAPRTQVAADVRELPKAGVRGRVLDIDGKAIAGARVCANAWSRGLSDFETRRPTCTLTAEDGGYGFSALVPATYSISASAKGFIGAVWSDSDDEQSFRLAASQTRDGIDVRLRRGGVLVRGVVKDIGGGGVAGALVTGGKGGWFNFSGEGSMSAIADEKGEFELWVAKGSIRVSAIADGYANGDSEGVAPGQFIEVLLTPESVLMGKVVEVGTGEPVARAKVSAGGTSVFTDKNGEFRIAGLLLSATNRSLGAWACTDRRVRASC